MKDDKRGKIKPRNNSENSKQEESAPSGQERIAEKLSISVPTQPLLRPTGLGPYFGKQVRLLLKDGNVIKGFLQGRRWNYLNVLNIEETGKDEKLTADWCGVGVDGVARVYPGNAKVEKISKP